ncbi:protein arginine kinase [Aureibacillus halotolerans]|uniref:Protein-arginine kinase n=1 Tax=Aureibacillus halotolerans TaxID=1508390 RepID=A0A4R6TR26_9BACI|nr:protein arginine kinase [Aureibacillus halotolerans]TDQ34680.1 protein arginine kinase [Aureibacillus halotolerans]
MSLHKFIQQALSPWHLKGGPDSDIVMSSRIRYARNLNRYSFPTVAGSEELQNVLNQAKTNVMPHEYGDVGRLSMLEMSDLKNIEKRVLMEKQLISPNLAGSEKSSAVLLSDEENISLMVNEEDHFRLQCLFPGFQLTEALAAANQMDDILENHLEYAYDEEKGYLTSCPTNVGTGMRASVMMHLPALIMSGRMNTIISAINQLGIAVRGIYGEGSEAQGNVFQVSNQLTLGKSEEDIVDDLQSVVYELIQKEREMRGAMLDTSRVQLEDRVWRSYGILSHSRVIQSAEAASCLSDVRLGIDLGFIDGLSQSILSEVMILMQPGFLQQYANEALEPKERDIRRATLIRERVKLEKI